MINNFSPVREINQRDKYFFKKMISNLPDLIFQLSYSSSGILTFPFFNKAVINYFELTKEQVRNFNITSVFREKIHPDDFDAMLISLQKLNENQSNWSFEFRAILPSKGLRWFKAVANIDHSDFDTIVMTGRMSDITVEKQLEVDLKISEQRDRKSVV